MSLWRRAAKRDEGEKELVEFARSMGAKIWYLTKPCDLLMLWCAHFHCVETKRAKGGRSKSFTKDELEFRRVVQEHGGCVLVWRTPEDVRDSLNALRGQAWKRA